MRKIVSYGPALVVLLACAAVLLTAPWVARRVSFASTEARISLTRQELAQEGILAQLDAAISGVAESVTPSVVHIDTAGRRGSVRASSGAGWVYDSSGVVVTNAHVIRGAEAIIVEFADGRATSDVGVIGSDPYTDIAVLRVGVGGGVASMPLSQRAAPRVGERVFAFGSPFGFKFSMSEGIISGLGREPPGAGAFGGFTNYLQTDAAVNPGNSGGPLVNIRGELIGMNVAIATARNANGSLEDDSAGDSAGISFAIPLGTIRPIVEQIVEHGDVRRGFLGISFQPDTSERRLGPDQEPLIGVRVNAVEQNGPADAAGVQAGDLIVEIEGSPVLGEQALRSLVSSGRPGETIAVQVLRGGELLARTITLGELPSETRYGSIFREMLLNRAGLWLSVTSSGRPEVTRLVRGGLADEAGFRIGDVFVAVEGVEVDEFSDAMSRLERAGLLAGLTVNVTVDRGGDRVELGLSIN